MRDKDNAIICRMTMSKWRTNNSVPTYFVSAKPRKGCFTQINDAIQYAQPYSRIELLSGTFTEAVVINKCIEIGSEKGDEQAIVAYHLTAVVLQAKEAYIEGITVRNTENQAAMRIDRGSPTIARCDIGGIEVGGDATPTIEECKVESSPVHGISVLQVAGGVYKGNSIINSGWYGIHVESTGPATFMHNSVTESAQGQIIIQGNNDVTPVFQYNRIIDQVKSSVDPSLLHQTQAYKLEHLPIKTAGQTVVIMPLELTTAVRVALNEDNVDDAVVHSVDSRCAVDIGGCTHPSFVRNTVVGSMNNGFYVHSGAHGTFEHNYVTSNRGWGFVLDGQHTKAHLIANSLNGNGGGIKAVNSPSVVDGKNEFVENRGPQLMLINGHEEFRFSNNEVRSGSKVGVLCRDGGSGTIDNNSFDQCGTAIRTEHGANPMVTDNVIAMTNMGVCAVRGGRGVFVDNEFGNLSIICVLISTGGDPSFTNCRFLTSNNGILVTKGGRGTFQRCILKDNKGVQLEVADRANPVVTDCFIADGRDDGVKIHHRGKGIFRRNLIAGNERAQVCIRTGGDPIIDENIISRSHHDGILVEDKGLGVITNNVVERCRLSGISVVAQSMPIIRGNIITLCRDAGLLIGEEGGGGTYEKNDIFNNRKANVQICGAGVVATASAAVDPNSAQKRKALATSTSSSAAAPAAALSTSTTTDNNNNNENDMPLSSTEDVAAINYNLVIVRANKIYDAVGYGLLATSRCEAMVCNNLFQANYGGAVRVATGSEVSVVQNEFIAGTDGVIAVEDSRVRVLSNSFSDLRGAALTFDEGAKCLAMWNSTEHCLHGVVLRNSTGMCFLNSIIQSTDSGIVLGAQCRASVKFNTMFEDDVGARVEHRARGALCGNVIFESEQCGIVVDGEETHTVIDTNVIINAKHAGVCVKKGSPKLQFNLIMNSAHSGIEVQGSRTSPHFLNCYISCCLKGIVWGEGSGGRLENSIIGHCDVGVELNSSPSGHLRGCVVHNCNAVGVLGTGGSSCTAEIGDCVFFKNFINALFTDGCKVNMTNSLLQAAVVFSVVCTNSAAPNISRCVVASRALGGDDDHDEAREADKQAGIIFANLKKRFGEQKLRDQWNASYAFKIRSLWDDLYSTIATSVGGLPAEWLPAAEVASSVGDDGIGDEVLSDGRGGGGYGSSALRSHTGSAYSSFSRNTSRPQSAMSSASSQSGMESSGAAAATGVSPNKDPHEDSMISSFEVGSDNGNPSDTFVPPAVAAAAPMAYSVVTIADILKSKAVPIARRTAILFPSNMNESMEEFIGPGGPFVLHRLLGGETNSYLKGMFTYYSTGLRVDHDAHPAIESCVFRDHRYREAKIMSKRMPPPPNADPLGGKLLSNPNLRNMLAERSAHEAAKKLRHRLSSIKGPMPPLGAAGGGHRKKRGGNTKRREVEIHQPADDSHHHGGGGGGGGQGDGASSHGGSILSLPGAPMTLDRTRFVDQVLLAASPCFYQHPAAPHPSEALPSLFDIPSERQAREEAAATVGNVLASTTAKVFLTNVVSRSILDDAHPPPQNGTFISTECTVEFTGFGAMFCNGGRGTITRCQFFRNHCGLKIESNAAPVISYCSIFHQNVDGVWIRHLGSGVLRANKVLKNKRTQIRIDNSFSSASSSSSLLTTEGHAPPPPPQQQQQQPPPPPPSLEENEVCDSHSPGIVVSGPHVQCSITSNTFANITTKNNAAVIVEFGAEPTIRNNDVTECFNGLLFRFGGCGQADMNRITSCANVGILVEGGYDLISAEPTLEKNDISECGDCGIAVVGQGTRPSFTSNIVTSNRGHGVSVSNGASANFMDNQLVGNDGHGFSFTNSASGLVEGNSVSSSKFHGVHIASDASPFVQRNVIFSGKQYGVFIEDAAGTVSLNRILEHSAGDSYHDGGGVRVSGAASSTIIEQNEIDSNTVGMCFSNGCRPECANNIITRSIDGGIIVEGRLTQPTIRGTYLKSNHRFGVKFHLCGAGTLEETIVACTSGNGIELFSSCNPTIRSCCIVMATENGVYAGSGGAGTVLESLVAQCEKAGILLNDSSGQFRCKQSVVADCRDAAVRGETNARGSVTGSTLLGKFLVAGAIMLPTAKVVFDGTLFVDQRIGLLNHSSHTQGLDCLFQSCTTGVSDVNEESGAGGGIMLQASEFRDCQSGVQCVRGSSALKQCQFVASGRSGVTVLGESAPVIEGCTFQRCRVAIAMDSGGGVVDGNEVFNCADGLFISSDGEVKNNTVYDCANAGITVRDGNPSVLANLVFDNFNAGIILEKGGGLLEDNRVFFARDDGALVVKPTSATVQNRNTLKNSFSPPKEKNYAERQSMYKRQEQQEKEKSSALFRRMARTADTVCMEILRWAGEHAERLVDATTDGAVWLFEESFEDPNQPVAPSASSPQQSTSRQAATPRPVPFSISPRAASGGPFGSAAPTDDGGATPPVPQIPSVAAVVPLTLVDRVPLAKTKDKLNALLDTIRPAKSSAGGAPDPAMQASVATAPTKPKGARASVARRASKKSLTT